MLALLAGSIAIFLFCINGFPEYALLVPLALCSVLVLVRSAGFAVIVFTGIIYMNAAAVFADSHGIRIFGDLVAMLMLATVGYQWLRGRRMDQAVLPLLVSIIYLASLAVTALYARDPEAVLGRVADSAKICAVMILLTALVHSMEQFQRVCAAIVFAAMLMSLLTVIQSTVTGYSQDFGGFALAHVQQVLETTNGWRPSGPLTDPNFYAQILAIALPLSLQIMMSGSNWFGTMFGLAASILICIALLLTFSRGGLIGGGASFLAIMFFNRRLITKRHIFVAGLVGCLGLIALPPHYYERLAFGLTSLEQISSGGFGQDQAIAGRASELMAALSLAERNPLLGVGYGEFKSYYQELSVAQGLMARGVDREAHSLYLEILSERGLVGLSIFAILLTISAVSVRRAISLLQQQNRYSATNAVGAWAAAMVGYLVTSIFLHESYTQYFWLLMMIALALPILAAGKSPERHSRGG